MTRARVSGWAVALVLVGFLVPGLTARQTTLDPIDRRASRLQDADHFRWAPPDPFPTRQAWEQRARQLRMKLLLSAGLWPERARTPLNATVFDIKQGDGFKVGKVYFESLPGFLVTGNIYYPVVGKPPYPAVLTPHGHWNYGRLQNTEPASIPARSIDFARQGYVVFSIDMIGYNDSFQLPHDGNKSRAQVVGDTPLPYEARMFRADFDFPGPELYGFNLGGLQLWNGIRALDFLSALPEVDASRIGVTGESGGATQTLLLMAADDRVRVAAPVDIIGAEKHPGCSCENLPGLWVDTSTIELAATFAPRPLLMVSATEDPWTNSTPTRELPMMRRYFDLLGVPDRLGNTHVKAAHNYNSQSRAGVYAFFRTHLNPPGPAIENPPPTAVEMKTLGDLRVFPDTVLPKSARTGRVIAQDWVRTSVAALTRAFPTDAASLAAFRSTFGPALALVLSVEKPAPAALLRALEGEETRDAWTVRRERIGRRGRGDAVELESLRGKAEPSGAVLLVAPESFGRLQPGTGLAALPWVRTLLENGRVVYRVRGYASGQLRVPDRTWDSFAVSGAYNRPNEVQAIQDVLTAIAGIRQTRPATPLTVVGLESAGLGAVFAAAIDGGSARLIADLNGEDPGVDRTFRRLLPVGGIRAVGDLKTAVLMMSGPVHLLNPGPTFDRAWFLQQAKGPGVNVAIHEAPDLTDAAVFRPLF